MKFSFSVSVDKFNKQKYKKAVDAEMKKVFMEAGRKFLLAAIPRIPIWTGMLRGAFRNAEDLFGRVEARGAHMRSRQKLKGSSSNTTDRRAYYYPPGGGRVLRTPEAGRSFSTPSGEIVNLKGASLATGRMGYYFKYEVDIKYFDLLDEKRGWKAWDAATKALVGYVTNTLELPNPLKYTTRKIIKVG